MLTWVWFIAGAHQTYSWIEFSMRKIHAEYLDSLPELDARYVVPVCELQRVRLQYWDLGGMR